MVKVPAGPCLKKDMKKLYLYLVLKTYSQGSVAQGPGCLAPVFDAHASTFVHMSQDLQAIPQNLWSRSLWDLDHSFE